jgi:hypothetical protein
MVTAGPIVFPLEDATTVLNGLARIGKMGDEDLTAWSVFRQAPPFPFVPEEMHFKPVLIVAVCFVGDAEAAELLLIPSRNLETYLGMESAVSRSLPGSRRSMPYSRQVLGITGRPTTFLR